MKRKIEPRQYEVGFKKPPKHTRFAKGKSGNPHGRPKGRRTWAAVLHDELGQKVRVVENGRSKEVTKLEAAMTQLVNGAAGGDREALRLLFQVVPHMEQELARTGASPLSDEQDRNVVAVLLKRMGIPGAGGDAG